MYKEMILRRKCLSHPHHEKEPEKKQDPCFSQGHERKTNHCWIMRDSNSRVEAKEWSDGPNKKQDQDADGYIHISYMKHCSPTKKFNFDEKCGSHICISEAKRGPQAHISQAKCRYQIRISEAKCKS